jgi:hypothetical protein
VQSTRTPRTLDSCLEFLTDNMLASYCFWSLSDGTFAEQMKRCVESARRAGVFKEFHILTDRPIENCECYDACSIDKAHGLFKLHYLKAGMSRLNFEYFVWIDSDTIFLRNPSNLLESLSKAPLHVPFEARLSAAREERWRGQSLSRVGSLMTANGVMHEPFFSQSAFWIIHHDAIETVYDLSMEFWHKAKREGMEFDVAFALGYAGQILCGDPEKHIIDRRVDLWVSDDFRGTTESKRAGAWFWKHFLRSETIEVHPAIVHNPSPECCLKAE